MKQLGVLHAVRTFDPDACYDRERHHNHGSVVPVR